MLANTHPIYSTLPKEEETVALVELYVNSMARRADELDKFYVARDWEALRRVAHQIKGSATSYGFAQLSLAATQLELIIRHRDDFFSIASAAEQLIDLCRRVRNW